MEESPQGLRRLYVALTRPTRRLSVLHLPATGVARLEEHCPGDRLTPGRTPVKGARTGSVLALGVRGH